jgi:hypothetical protein
LLWVLETQRLVSVASATRRHMWIVWISHLNAAFFVTRARSNLQCRRLHTQPVDKTTSLRCDQTIVLTNYYSKKDYSIKLRRIKYHDAQTNKTLVFLTNNFTLPALTICELYRYR